MIQRPTAANLLNGNLQFASVTDTWSNAELHDSTALLPQRNIPRIKRIKKEIKAYKAQTATGAARPPPKSYAEKIGSLESCDDVLSLAVNSSNVSAAFVNFEAMEVRSNGDAVHPHFSCKIRAWLLQCRLLCMDGFTYLLVGEITRT